jgi:ketosteroid isomerase-like protein
MTRETLSRRAAFGVGTSVLAAAAGLPEIAKADVGKGLNPETEKLIRKHYDAWDRKDWHTEDMLLADDFTFSSAAGDDHISKSVFKTRCWDNNAKEIKRFDLLKVFGSGDEALVEYACVTMNDNTLRNVEYLRFKNGKLETIECYFGAPSNYPAAVSARK